MWITFWRLIMHKIIWGVEIYLENKLTMETRFHNLYISMWFIAYMNMRASLIVQSIKNLPAMQETWVRFLGREDPLEKEMAIHSSILAGKSRGQRRLAGYNPWGHKSRTRLSDYTTTTMWFMCSTRSFKTPEQIICFELCMNSVWNNLLL